MAFQNAFFWLTELTLIEAENQSLIAELFRDVESSRSRLLEASADPRPL